MPASLHKLPRLKRHRNWSATNISLPDGLKQALATIASRRYKGTPYASFSGLVTGLLKEEQAHKKGLIVARAAMF